MSELNGSHPHSSEPNPGPPSPPRDDDVFTDEEYEEFFGDAQSTQPLAPRSQRLGRTPRLVGLFVASAMALGGILTLADNVRTSPEFFSPAEIEAAAWAGVNESPLGWIVEDLVVQPIDRPEVGAFVTNNPPDGVITIDLRPWNAERLDELMDHEIGHLLDFALWEPRDEARKGGLGTEAWAECAAVDAGTRRTDPRDPGGEYHCFADEYDTFRNALQPVSQLCKRWGDRECRPFTLGERR